MFSLFIAPHSITKNAGGIIQHKDYPLFLRDFKPAPAVTSALAETPAHAACECYFLAVDYVCVVAVIFVLCVLRLFGKIFVIECLHD